MYVYVYVYVVYGYSVCVYVYVIADLGLDWKGIFEWPKEAQYRAPTVQWSADLFTIRTNVRVFNNHHAKRRNTRNS